MRNIQVIGIGLIAATSALIVPGIASAGVILSKDFKSGLSAKERIVQYGTPSSFGIHDGYFGHNGNYANLEESLYVADLDLTSYRNVVVSYDLVSKVEDTYDIFRTVVGRSNAAGQFETTYGAETVFTDMSRSFRIALPDSQLASQFAFRFVSDRSVVDAGVQIRNLLITGDRIAAPDVPPVAGVVPEPGTWAMMVAGFGLVGGMIRRRRTRRSARRVLA